ncbi:MAG: 50S ribosomal protein L18 [Bacilli bacterium]
MIKKESRNSLRKIRHARVRVKISGTDSSPRLNIFKSNKNLVVQIIDDIKGVTLVSANTMSKEFDGMNKTEKATKLGEVLAKKAKEVEITTVVFDRGGYLYHGVVKAFAEAARENGLEF